MKNFVLLCTLALPLHLFAQSSQHGLPLLQNSWAIAQYQTPEDQREDAFETLLRKAEGYVAQAHHDAETLTWRGIIKASYAGAKGGLGALKLVKSAKKDFERALKIDEGVLLGAAHTSLGSLYYQVPGWPLGFGDDKQAAKHLKAGLEFGNEDIDANYFYGDFLARQGDKAQARIYLQKALAAPDRPGRELADRGRREEIEALLKSL